MPNKGEFVLSVATLTFKRNELVVSKIDPEAESLVTGQYEN